MALQWKAVLPQDMCILSKSVVNDQLAMASHLQLKVLLWFAANTCDITACAVALRKPQEVIEEAVRYWVAAGVLLSDELPVEQVTAPAPSTTTETPVAPATRPLPVKPQMKDVIKRQQESREFSNLLHDVSARFGKPITHGDMETLLYLYDTAGISADVILMVVGYAVSRGKINMRFVEKIALDWQDSGITTFAAAEEHLLLLQQMDDAAVRVQALTGKARALDYRQRGMAHTWLYVWHFSEEVIRMALEQAGKTTKALIPYANSVLARWHEEGMTDPAAIKAASQKQTPAARRGGQTEQSSLDLPEYEQMLESYIPTLPKKQGKE